MYRMYKESFVGHSPNLSWMMILSAVTLPFPPPDSCLRLLKYSPGVQRCLLAGPTVQLLFPPFFLPPSITSFSLSLALSILLLPLPPPFFFFPFFSHHSSSLVFVAFDFIYEPTLCSCSFFIPHRPSCTLICHPSFIYFHAATYNDIPHLPNLVYVYQHYSLGHAQPPPCSCRLHPIIHTPVYPPHRSPASYDADTYSRPIHYL
ncbi:uncharacterized protein BP01DRAFT_210616 [Aspergillus saccharolyticus JOP 1030-1]|uniref:Uncharacterized protein n=1 Tax=Aspergillus saccharolyticus JOP 1030-1 TaxID=1450539 RepID=A0A318ZJP8_9EURO|nr:hypothetical protein BP01DRAFT_210616 [Aspergillus saccharolyticus JOP 1030-1]PYH40488.1 hypothetical protein BP01DRAFT_210616 [Aspergillus saccharolyticus JOP 1030-1]